MKPLGIPLSIAVFSASCASPPQPAPVPPPQPVRIPEAQQGTVNFSSVEREIFHYVNVERARNRLDTLVFNAALDKAAKIQATEMAAERKMAHELPGAAYPTLKDRAAHVGYGYRRIAENIAYGYPNARAVVDGWIKSPAHRANILYKGVVETGVGVARASTGELYYAQLFGARLY
jgi:uncharacterized protein YkwD